MLGLNTSLLSTGPALYLSSPRAISSSTSAAGSWARTARPRCLGFPKVPVPFYNGTAWFLPFAGAYYRAKDRLR
jgi:hypothetical protein